MKKLDLFKSLSDPTRRKIINLLIISGGLSINSISDNFEMSRQAVSKHLTILEKTGLMEVSKHGRERLCQINLDKLHEMNTWISKYEKFWTGKLDDLERFLEDD